MVFQRMYVWCACDHSVRLDAHFICLFVCVCMSEVISSFMSLRPGSQVFDLHLFFSSLCDFACYAVRYASDPFYFVLVCHQYEVCKNDVGSVYVGRYGGLSESVV